MQLAHENILWHLCHKTGEIDRWNGWNLYQWEVFSTRTKWMEKFFAYLWVILLYFSLESRLIPEVLELVKLFWKLIRSRIWQLSHSCQTGVWEYFPSSLTVKYEDGMLILGRNYKLSGHSAVHFSVWFLQLTVFKYLVASHVTGPGSLLTEPGAVIKLVLSAVSPVHVC